MWISDDVLSWHGAQLVYDITGPNVDHKMLTLRVGKVLLQNEYLLRRYIPTGSEEEELFIFFIFKEMAKWDARDPSLHAKQLVDSCCVAWSRFSKPGKAQYSRWWNKDCLSAKFHYEATPTLQA